MPLFKAAAYNLEGTFTPAAAEAGPKGSEEETGRSSTPVMTEAVCFWSPRGGEDMTTSLDQPTFGQIHHQAVCLQEIYPKMAMDTSANTNFRLE